MSVTTYRAEQRTARQIAGSTGWGYNESLDYLRARRHFDALDMDGAALADVLERAHRAGLTLYVTALSEIPVDDPDRASIEAERAQVHEFCATHPERCEWEWCDPEHIEESYGLSEGEYFTVCFSPATDDGIFSPDVHSRLLSTALAVAAEYVQEQKWYPAGVADRFV